MTLILALVAGQTLGLDPNLAIFIVFISSGISAVILRFSRTLSDSIVLVSIV